MCEATLEALLGAFKSGASRRLHQVCARSRSIVRRNSVGRVTRWRGLWADVSAGTGVAVVEVGEPSLLGLRRNFLGLGAGISPLRTSRV